MALSCRTGATASTQQDSTKKRIPIEEEGFLDTFCSDSKNSAKPKHNKPADIYLDVEYDF